MRFVLLVEENGYQVRYWNEMTQEIGSVIASSWDKSDLHKRLASKEIHIEKNVFNEAIKKIELEDKPFVVLKASEKNKNSIDLFIKEAFTIDEDDN